MNSKASLPTGELHRTRSVEWMMCHRHRDDGVLGRMGLSSDVALTWTLTRIRMRAADVWVRGAMATYVWNEKLTVRDTT